MALLEVVGASTAPADAARPYGAVKALALAGLRLATWAGAAIAPSTCAAGRLRGNVREGEEEACVTLAHGKTKDCLGRIQGLGLQC